MFFADFEGCSVGDDGSCEGFTPITGGWSVESEDTNKYYKAYGDKIITKIFDSLDRGFEIMTKLLFESDVAYGGGIQWDTTPWTDYRKTFVFPAHDKVKYYDDTGTGYDHYTTIGANTVYKLGFRIDQSGNVDVLWEGSVVISATTNETTKALTLIADDTPTRFDDIAIRKFINPEPSHDAWYHEETILAHNDIFDFTSSEEVDRFCNMNKRYAEWDGTTYLIFNPPSGEYGHAEYIGTGYAKWVRIVLDVTAINTATSGAGIVDVEMSTVNKKRWLVFLETVGGDVTKLKLRDYSGNEVVFDKPTGAFELIIDAESMIAKVVQNGTEIASITGTEEEYDADYIDINIYEQNTSDESFDVQVDKVEADYW